MGQAREPVANNTQQSCTGTGAMHQITMQWFTPVLHAATHPSPANTPSHDAVLVIVRDVFSAVHTSHAHHAEAVLFRPGGIEPRRV
eukprot:7256718-Prymnesium_polylepis.2